MDHRLAVFRERDYKFYCFHFSVVRCPTKDSPFEKIKNYCAFGENNVVENGEKRIRMLSFFRKIQKWVLRMCEDVGGGANLKPVQGRRFSKRLSH